MNNGAGEGGGTFISSASNMSSAGRDASRRLLPDGGDPDEEYEELSGTRDSTPNRDPFDMPHLREGRERCGKGRL